MYLNIWGFFYNSKMKELSKKTKPLKSNKLGLVCVCISLDVCTSEF